LLLKVLAVHIFQIDVSPVLKANRLGRFISAKGKQNLLTCYIKAKKKNIFISLTKKFVFGSRGIVLLHIKFKIWMNTQAKQWQKLP
jgi:membrane protein CcdC involved in cytochrome C biogenesis